MNKPSCETCKFNTIITCCNIYVDETCSIKHLLDDKDISMYFNDGYCSNYLKKEHKK